MECAVHAVSATETCAVCKKPACAECATYEIDARPICQVCGARETERSRAIGSAILGCVAVGYLATLAVAYLVFHARPFVGGLAAVVAIVLGRALQTVTARPSVVARRI